MMNLKFANDEIFLESSVIYGYTSAVYPDNLYLKSYALWNKNFSRDAKKESSSLIEYDIIDLIKLPFKKIVDVPHATRLIDVKECFLLSCLLFYFQPVPIFLFKKDKIIGMRIHTYYYNTDNSHYTIEFFSKYARKMYEEPDRHHTLTELNLKKEELWIY